ncbi:diiron oxygenase [Pseudomonas sp. SWRI107]|nr:diiron oxygenase [Pseudomonas farsensis]
MFQDHLIDESRHSIFFSDLFVTLWGGLSNSQKDFMVTCLIKTIPFFQGRTSTSYD